MVHDPELFFKAQEYVAIEAKAKELSSGIEGSFIYQLSMVTGILSRTVSLVPKVFYPHQELQERTQSIQAFRRAKTQFDLLTEAMKDVA